MGNPAFFAQVILSLDWYMSKFLYTPLALAYNFIIFDVFMTRCDIRVVNIQHVVAL